MESPLEPIQIPLTAEQQELIRRMFGQFAQAPTAEHKVGDGG
jgi:hypothetical protein